MNRLALGIFVAVCATLLAPAGRAAPVPKDASKADPTPDLKALFDTVGAAVKDEKWPADADEKKLTGTTRTVFERMLKAAEQKERPLPVDFDKLKKAAVEKEYKLAVLSDGFVVAGNVQVTSATGAAIFASGDVQITSAKNCVIFARNVRCTLVENCVVVADEYVRLTSARQRNGNYPSVLVAGQWARVTLMEGTICHVLRPGTLPAPDENNAAVNRSHPAVHTNSAKGAIFLNAESDTNNPKNCTYLPQKLPIAK